MPIRSGPLSPARAGLTTRLAARWPPGDAHGTSTGGATMRTLSSAAAILVFAVLGPPQADSAGSKPGEEKTVAGVKLRWCPPGRFTMGSPPGEPERRPGEDQVEVRLTRGFW